MVSNLNAANLFFLGMMVESIKGSGKMVNSTAKENFLTLKKQYGKKDFGVRVEELNGTAISSLLLNDTLGKVFHNFKFQIKFIRF